MDNKQLGAAAVLAAVILVGIFALTSMKPEKQNHATVSNPTTTIQQAGRLTEAQSVACEAADKADTCKTRLPKLIGLVAWQDCCKYMNKCCN